jgi:hypothetical protein
MFARRNASRFDTAVEKGVGRKALFFLGEDENRCQSVAIYRGSSSVNRAVVWRLEEIGSACCLERSVYFLAATKKYTRSARRTTSSKRFLLVSALLNSVLVRRSAPTLVSLFETSK